MKPASKTLHDGSVLRYRDGVISLNIGQFTFQFPASFSLPEGELKSIYRNTTSGRDFERVLTDYGVPFFFSPSDVAKNYSKLP